MANVRLLVSQRAKRLAQLQIRNVKTKAGKIVGLTCLGQSNDCPEFSYKENCMIHKYQLNGYNIVLDVNSGAVHVVDKLFYALLDFCGNGKLCRCIVPKKL